MKGDSTESCEVKTVMEELPLFDDFLKKRKD
jgi:hypothetical protein